MLAGPSVFTIGFLIVFSTRLLLSTSQSQQTGALTISSVAIEVALKLSLALIPNLLIRFLHHEPLASFGISWSKTPVRHLMLEASTALLWLFLDYSALVLIFGSSIVTFNCSAEMHWGVRLFYFVHLLTLNSLGEKTWMGARCSSKNQTKETEMAVEDEGHLFMLGIRIQ